MVRPVWQLSSPSLLFTIPSVRADWVFFESAPHFLKSATFFSDGKIYSPSANSWDTRYTSSDEPKPFASGYRHTIYTAIGTTNVFGVAVPIEFKVEDFIPRYDSEREGLRVYVSYEGRVQAIHSECELSSFIPHLTVPADVTDYRTMELSPPVSHLFYRSTNAAWLQMTDGFLLQKYGVRVHAQAAMARAAHAHAGWQKAFLVVFALLSLSGFVAIVLRARKRAVETETTTAVP